ncbi:hypothetical protein AB1Y20_018995 [Prymnesium parvum]|uniref:WW domain-containing protein n=1 Tax=Prymnesium parvum TaxID=97485 RepID=A0AB34JQ66_PRYPA
MAPAEAEVEEDEELQLALAISRSLEEQEQARSALAFDGDDAAAAAACASAAEDGGSNDGTPSPPHSCGEGGVAQPLSPSLAAVAAMTAQHQASSPPLPEGWVALVDARHGREYYFDTANQCASWEPPTVGSSVGGRVGSSVGSCGGGPPGVDGSVSSAVSAVSVPSYVLPAGWEVGYDQVTGHYFYIDRVNHCTSWTAPPSAPADDREDQPNVGAAAGAGEYHTAAAASLAGAERSAAGAADSAAEAAGSDAVGEESAVGAGETPRPSAAPAEESSARAGESEAGAGEAGVDAGERGAEGEGASTSFDLQLHLTGRAEAEAAAAAAAAAAAEAQAHAVAADRAEMARAGAEAAAAVQAAASAASCAAAEVAAARASFEKMLRERAAGEAQLASSAPPACDGAATPEPTAAVDAGSCRSHEEGDPPAVSPTAAAGVEATAGEAAAIDATPPRATGAGVALPDGWEMGFDVASGHYYYVDTVHRCTSWTPPSASTAATPAGGNEEGGGAAGWVGGLPEGWEMRLDEATGHYFYVDLVNQRTSWTPPPLAPPAAVAATPGQLPQADATLRPAAATSPREARLAEEAAGEAEGGEQDEGLEEGSEGEAGARAEVVAAAAATAAAIEAAMASLPEDAARDEAASGGEEETPHAEASDGAGGLPRPIAEAPAAEMPSLADQLPPEPSWPPPPPPPLDETPAAAPSLDETPAVAPSLDVTPAVAPVLHEPPPVAPGVATCSAAAQTEWADEDDAMEEAAALRERYDALRKQYWQLETRLDGEGAVLLRAFRTHKQQMATLQAECEAARRGHSNCREWLALRVAQASSRALLERCLAAWRWAVADVRNQAAALKEEAPKVEAPKEEAPKVEAPKPKVEAPKKATQHVFAKLPAKKSRKDLYRMSYEALIDQVLELQDVAREIMAHGAAGIGNDSDSR